MHTTKHSLPICRTLADKHYHWLLQNTENVVNTCCSSYISAMLYFRLLLTDPNHCIDSTDMSPSDPKSASIWKKEGDKICNTSKRRVLCTHRIQYITPVLWKWNWSPTIWNAPSLNFESVCKMKRKYWTRRLWVHPICVIMGFLQMLPQRAKTD